MDRPQGFPDPNRPSHVCKLHKAIYGLEQAPWTWYLRLTNYLQSLGFIGSNADTSLFVRQLGGEFIIFLIYVDDIVITSNHVAAMPKLLRDLGSLFAMKDLGPLHYFIGIEACRVSSNLYLTQTKYVWDLLHKTQMHDAKPIKSPVQPGWRLSKTDGDPITNSQDYRSVVGALQYVTLTRPDIAFAVNQVCQFMHDARSTHWMAIKQILPFLKGTLTHRLHFRKRPTSSYYLL